MNIKEKIEYLNNFHPSSDEVLDEECKGTLLLSFYSNMKHITKIDELPSNAVRVFRLKDFFISERYSYTQSVQDRGFRVDLFLDDEFVYIKQYSYEYVSISENVKNDVDEIKIFKLPYDIFIKTLEKEKG